MSLNRQFAPAEFENRRPQRLAGSAVMSGGQRLYTARAVGRDRLKI
ncbi:hypothetical protein [Zobellella sp. DQSA1]